LAVIYLTKLQNLINLPVMNCSMSSFFIKLNTANTLKKTKYLPTHYISFIRSKNS